MESGISVIRMFEFSYYTYFHIVRGYPHFLSIYTLLILQSSTEQEHGHKHNFPSNSVHIIKLTSIVFVDFWTSSRGQWNRIFSAFARQTLRTMLNKTNSVDPDVGIFEKSEYHRYPLQIRFTV